MFDLSLHTDLEMLISLSRYIYVCRHLLVHAGIGLVEA